MYAACFHLLQLPPQVLVVDDISDFIDSRHARYLSKLNQPRCYRARAGWPALTSNSARISAAQDTGQACARGRPGADAGTAAQCCEQRQVRSMALPLHYFPHMPAWWRSPHPARSTLPGHAGACSNLISTNLCYACLGCTCWLQSNSVLAMHQEARALLAVAFLCLMRMEGTLFQHTFTYRQQGKALLPVPL